MKPVAALLFLVLLSVAAQAGPGKIGALSFELPSRFKLQPTPASRGEDAVKRWEAPDGASIEVFLYYHDIKQERGGIVAATKDSIEVAGQRTKLISTRIFFGEPKQVLAVYLNFGDSIYLFVGDHISERDFMRLLQGINVEN